MISRLVNALALHVDYIDSSLQPVSTFLPTAGDAQAPAEPPVDYESTTNTPTSHGDKSVTSSPSSGLLARAKEKNRERRQQRQVEHLANTAPVVTSDMTLDRRECAHACACVYVVRCVQLNLRREHLR
jgi:hypothetical protein